MVKWVGVLLIGVGLCGLGMFNSLRLIVGGFFGGGLRFGRAVNDELVGLVRERHFHCQIGRRVKGVWGATLLLSEIYRAELVTDA